MLTQIKLIELRLIKCSPKLNYWAKADWINKSNLTKTDRMLTKIQKPDGKLTKIKLICLRLID